MINIDEYRNKIEFTTFISLNKASSECITSNALVLEFYLSGTAKYSDDEYIDTKKAFSEINGRCFLLCYEKDMELANRLLWECNNICAVLYVDSIDPYKAERLVQRRDKVLWNLQAGFSKESDKAFMSGWKNSYNNQQFSDEEILEYINNTKLKLESYLDENSKVLEIGCGSGMISDVIAPLVKKYDGVDISDAVLEKLRISNVKNGITNMELFNIAANEISSLGRIYDIILSSSVTEYFSGYNYLRNVVCDCIKCVNDNGVIFFGDVFDLDLRDQYIDSVNDYQRRHEDAKASNSFMFELFISPRYWYDLMNTIPEIYNVEITRKIGMTYNEINRFRYDVLLHIKKSEVNRCKGIQKPLLFKYQFAREDQES